MQPPKLLLGKKTWNLAASPAMPRDSALLDNTAVARRLITLRHYVAGNNQTKFATEMGIEVKRWNNFERASPLSRDIALLLCSKIPGLTLDWLYRGVEDGLPVALQRSLVAVDRALSSAVRRG